MSLELHEIRPHPLREDLELKAYIHDRLELFNEWSSHYDITSLSYDEAARLTSSLVAGADIVLHGSDSDLPYTQLDPAFSKPITKIPSVFATTDARVALMNATFRTNGGLVNSIRHQVDEGNGFAAAMYVHGQTRIFEAPPGIAAALRDALVALEENEQCDDFFTDGLLYVAAGRLFTRDDPRLDVNGQRVGGVSFTDHELNCSTAVSPLATLRVSRYLARDLFRINGDENDTVHVYSEEEMELRRKWRRDALTARTKALGATSLRNS